MRSPIRLSLALEAGDLVLPEAARIAVFAPREGDDLSPLPKAFCHVITGFRPDHDYFAGLGYACAVAPEGRYGAALVCLPRAKARARALIAEAVAVTDGPVIVDGAKTDGVESVLKECRKRAIVTGPVNKAHGKLFSFPAGPGFEDWAAHGPDTIEGGFVTAPGVFSADGIDPASRFLADHLPAKLGKTLADLGGGWGYLSARALEGRDEIEALHLIEADHAALGCARQNLPDARVLLHWEDATRWRPDTALDCVITNPPFHTGREADPELGRAFIRAAAACLKPGGQLWLVANRHLPYEAEMERHFTRVEEAAGDTRFKILHGRGPSRKGR
ncbi:16S rRNA (guanine1207-N2)-methyltransferase [Roseovarius halotolerans]|uniref:Ribosomal RNA large subunit methyltransferase G n=1 Tax=Roseovarius halotolerans TaxID=505353 RepID=A0A1X6YHB4_9RHOB|nr:class I SAM-dependent methyltransferase [Roseovarius halotolerans]RKT34626.1 16S rRNA (guanine1207-N2)-methyltransferase [Roseovarius halotolerans]SLN21205.1 Ribosomal RNA large subunit methyltransferase G [Roseovarius halotolerans]